MKVAAGLSSALALAITAIPAANAAPWSRSWVIDYYEFAHIYGREDAADAGPGPDCPHGANPDVDWTKVLLVQGRTPADVAKLLDPERRSQPGFDRSFYYNRGPNGENIYLEPELVTDTAQFDVEGAQALGFDLDADASTGGFVSPDGKAGIDNAFYRASGCYMTFRGPEKGIATYSNDGMHDGVFSIVVVVSGEESPENDSNARLGFYLSQDKMAKDANGDIAKDYTFRIDPDPNFETVADVTVRDGIVETKAPITMTVRDYRTPGFFPKELVLEKAQVRLEMADDGSLRGMFGGYREWMVHYTGLIGNGRYSSGAIHETVSHINLPVWWHALRRHADGMPDPETGEMRGISTVYRIWAQPAFVATPDGKRLVRVARSFAEADVAEAP